MSAWTILKSTASDFSEDECMSSGAALAYYTIFSLPPLLAIVFAIASWLGVSQEKIDTVVREQLGMPSVVASDANASKTGSSADPQTNSSETKANTNELGTRDSAEGAQPTGLSGIAGNAQTQREGNLFTRIASVVLLIFSATGLLAQLQISLNRAWEVEPDPDQSGIKNFAIKRVLSFGMIVVVAFLLLVAMVITTLIDEILAWISSDVPGTVQIVLAHVLNAASTIAIATLLFAAMYKILPDAKVQWKDVVVGALVTAVLFVIGKTLIGLYLSSSDVGSGWGAAAGSLISILVWVYYTSLIVLLGAEFTQVWAKSRGREIEPVAGAVRKIEEKRIIRGPSRTASAG